MNQEVASLVDLLVVATREVSLEPQPGIVEVMVFDVLGKKWCFVDKYPIFGLEHCYFPSAALLRCQVIEVDIAKNQVLVSASNSYQIGDENSQTVEFWVRKNQLIAVSAQLQKIENLGAS